MRGVAGMVVAAATLLAGVPTASAGTYDVVSCGAPGAGGVNRAWRPECGGFDLDGDHAHPAGSRLVRHRRPVPGAV